MHKGEPAWQEVPGEYRSTLRRIIVTQGDTEPASVEQQRLLGMTAPSLYDLRNLFQVNVEEGRHLWAMVYLLHRYFGRDGREEAEALLERRSGDADNPRILDAFNEATPIGWRFSCSLSSRIATANFSCARLPNPASIPWRAPAGSCSPKKRTTCLWANGHQPNSAAHLRSDGEHKVEDASEVRALGVIDLQTMQKYLNFHFSVTIDLFGSDASSNAASYYTTGLKGRYEETKIEDDHELQNAEYPVLEVSGNGSSRGMFPRLTALNERLRDDYIAEIQAAWIAGTKSWSSSAFRFV